LQLNEEAAESQKTEEELEKARAERESHEKACHQQSALVRQLEQELKAHAHSAQNLRAELKTREIDNLHTDTNVVA